MIYTYDLHCHTHLSPDSKSNLRDVVYYAKKRGLTGIAITDHNVLYSGPQIIDGLTIIPGCEITLYDGTHLLTYFLKRPLSHELSLDGAMQDIKSQGGYGIISHPFRERQGMFDCYDPGELITRVDGVEYLNAKDSPEQRKKMVHFIDQCSSASLMCTAGSDAHIPEEIGFGVLITQSPLDRDNFLYVLQNAQFQLSVDVDSLNDRIHRTLKRYVRIVKKLRLYNIMPLKAFFYKAYVKYCKSMKKKAKFKPYDNR